MKTDYPLVAADLKTEEKRTASATRYPIPEQPKIPLGKTTLMLAAIVATIVVLYRILRR